MSEFELHIQPQVLERGLTYYEDGRVHDVRSDGMHIDAHVKGSELYEVSIALSKNVIIATNCTCKASQDGICKHIVALIFHVNEGEFQEGIEGRKGKKAVKIKVPKPEAKGSKTVKAKPSKAPKTPNLTTPELVDVVAPEELIEWTKDILASNKLLDKDFRAFFTRYLPSNSVTEVRQRVKEQLAILEPKGKTKWTEKVENRLKGYLEHWLDRCEEAFETRDYKQLVTIGKVVMEELLRNSTYYSMKKYMVAPLEVMTKAMESPLADSKLKKEVAEWINSLLDKGYYDQFPLSNVIQLEFSCQGTEEERVKFLDEWRQELSRRWSYEDSVKTLADLIEQVQGQRKAREFKRENLHYFSFRKEEIDLQIAKGDMDGALKTLMDGFKRHHDYAGYENPWLNELFQFHLNRGDIKSYRASLEDAFLSQPEDKWEFYDLLMKDQTEEEKGKIRKTLARRMPPIYVNRVFKMYLRENLHEELFDYLKELDSMKALGFRNEMLKIDPQRYCETLLNIIDEEVKHRRENRFYPTYSEIMSLVEETLGTERAKEFTLENMKRYPTSRGFHEALQYRRKPGIYGFWR